MSHPDHPPAPDVPPDAGELDPRLRALFRLTQAPPVLDVTFVRRVLLDVQRRRRRHLVTRAALPIAAVAVLGIGCAMTPALPGLQAAMRTLPLAAAGSVAPLGAWLLTPAGWAVSLLLGAAMLWRSKVIRR